MRHKATIRQLPNGNWQLDTMVDRVRHRAVIGSGSKRWAQMEADRILTERLNDGIVVPPVALLKTLHDAYKIYGESGQAKNGRLQDETITHCQNSFLRVAQAGGGLDEMSKLRAYTPAVVRNWHRKKYKEKLGLVGDEDDYIDEEEEARALYSLYSTWNQAKSVFGKRAIVYYKDRGIVGLESWAESLREIIIPRGEVPAYQLPPADLIRLTEAEGNKLKETNPEFYIIFKLAINCGLRAGEIAHMKPEWVEDYKGGKAVAIIRRPYFKPKGRPHRTPIDPKMWAEIQELSTGDKYLLPGTSNNRKQLVHRRFSKWMNDIGWEGYGKSAHELRKLYGSRIYSELGAEYAKEYLGHVSITTTCKFYATIDKPLAMVSVR